MITRIRRNIRIIQLIIQIRRQLRKQTNNNTKTHTKNTTNNNKNTNKKTKIIRITLIIRTRTQHELMGLTIRIIRTYKKKQKY